MHVPVNNYFLQYLSTYHDDLSKIFIQTLHIIPIYIISQNIYLIIIMIRLISLSHHFKLVFSRPFDHFILPHRSYVTTTSPGQFLKSPYHNLKITIVNLLVVPLSLLHVPNYPKPHFSSHNLYKFMPTCSNYRLVLYCPSITIFTSFLSMIYNK